MEWTFPADGPLWADLELSTGSVEIHLNATDEVKVRLEALGHESQNARAQIEETEVSCDGSRLYVRVPRRIRKLRDASFWLHVSMPTRSAARVRTASADITCAGVLGAFECTTASGDVVLRDDCDSAHVTTASGDIRMATVLGEAQAQTASGDVSITSVGGRTSVTTASGDTHLGSVAHDASIRTASGDVTVGCASDGELSVNTASGDVRIGVASGVGAWLDLVTVSGDSTCSLPAEGEGESAATLRILCRTLSGDIDVRSGTAPPRGGTAGDHGRPSAGGGGSGGAGGSDFPGMPNGPNIPDMPEIPELPEMPDLPDLPGLGGFIGLADLGEIGLKLGDAVERALRSPWRSD
jgi:DUF4097 and DUF4098 domain-containing protein YvlB